MKLEACQRVVGFTVKGQSFLLKFYGDALIVQNLNEIYYILQITPTAGQVPDMNFVILACELYKLKEGRSIQVFAAGVIFKYLVKCIIIPKLSFSVLTAVIC